MKRFGWIVMAALVGMTGSCADDNALYRDPRSMSAAIRRQTAHPLPLPTTGSTTAADMMTGENDNR